MPLYNRAVIDKILILQPHFHRWGTTSEGGQEERWDKDSCRHKNQRRRSLAYTVYPQQLPTILYSCIFQIFRKGDKRNGWVLHQLRKVQGIDGT